MFNKYTNLNPINSTLKDFHLTLRDIANPFVIQLNYYQIQVKVLEYHFKAWLCP